MMKTSNPAAVEKTAQPAAAAHTLQPEKKPLGLYIHIPFCLQKCGYCDFYSEAGLPDDLKQAYVKALCREIGSYGHQLSPEYTVDTVFLGGGTPSILPSHLTKSILSAVFDEFDVSADAEVSMECNPATLTEEKLGVYRAAGINRLSLGVQSMDDGLLQVMGRAHSRQDVVETVELARKAGFDNLNLDLMFGIPGQSRKMWEETVRTVFALNPEHLSFYSLELAEGTPFYRQVARGILEPTPQEEDRWMYHYLLRALQERGYEHYEISNSARPGYRCRHNLKYWDLWDLVHPPIPSCREDGLRRYPTYGPMYMPWRMANALWYGSMKTPGRTASPTTPSPPCGGEKASGRRILWRNSAKPSGTFSRDVRRNSGSLPEGERPRRTRSASGSQKQAWTLRTAS